MVGGGVAQNVGDAASSELWASLNPENKERLTHILRVQIPEVFSTNRVIEQKTGYRSKICKQMLVDALSHIGTLAQQEHELAPHQQASQLAKTEEHLRRALIEHPEEVLRNRVGDLQRLWSKYQRHAYPYRQAGELDGAPRHQELEELRQRIDVLLEAARRIKPAETTWEESLDASAAVTEAADIAADLSNKLEQCIGYAQRRTQEGQDRGTAKRHHRSMIAATVIVGILTTVGAFFLGKAADDAGRPPTQSGMP